MSAIFLRMSAWREILARAFERFEGQYNVSPEWLVNPATRRRLKLDCYYPAAAVAVRFVGLVAKGQRRRSDWEALEEEQRDQTRAELCRLHHVQLAIVDPVEDPVKQMDAFLRVLSRARRVASQAELQPADRRARMDGLGHAYEQASRLRSAIARHPDQMMATLADGWRDREAGLAVALQEASRVAGQERPATTDPTRFRIGQRVQHGKFGPGVITAVGGDREELKIAILFDGDQERTFLASLLADKLAILAD